MAAPASTTSSPAAGRDHSFHRLTVARVVEETPDARTIVLDVPEALERTFAYEPGQFCTFKVVVDGVTHHRCYSMSSTPEVDDEMAVTVKRVPGGIVSNWLLDHVAAGADVDVTPPAGVFKLAPAPSTLVAFAAGSGITPVFSLIKSALTGGDRPVLLLYANRDEQSVIFAAPLGELARRHASRFEIVHHLDVDRGFVDDVAVRSFLGAGVPSDAGFYLCGPTPFMDVVERALLDAGVAPERVHIERFTPAVVSGAPVEGEVQATVTVEFGGKRASTQHHPGTTLLQTARQAGLSPPSSCESGSCATCMARLVEGTARMHVNDALTPDEVDEGWVLTCQAVPTSAAVHVVYE